MSKKIKSLMEWIDELDIRSVPFQEGMYLQALRVFNRIKHSIEFILNKSENQPNKTKLTGIVLGCANADTSRHNEVINGFNVFYNKKKELKYWKKRIKELQPDYNKEETVILLDETALSLLDTYFNVISRNFGILASKDSTYKYLLCALEILDPYIYIEYNSNPERDSIGSLVAFLGLSSVVDSLIPNIKPYIRLHV